MRDGFASFYSMEDRPMKRLLLLALLLGTGTVGCGSAGFDLTDEELEPDLALAPLDADVASRDADFETPVRLMAGDAAVRVEQPGYAAPALADLNGDGQMHLLVGQFRSGKIRVFKHLDAEKFGPGDWLQAEGEVAEVPGVW
jgi:hypothetical protein